MAKVQVKFLVEMEQEIDWPEDEMEDFNYDSLVCNLDHENAVLVTHDHELLNVTVDGERHEF
ncbi:hypothetical protein [Pseudoalteromonas sp. MMG024]|uniref:hypothetical protein n=1 Tax=Pseudoalteromonas sp. MMG024 TaxID=2909980 RepID=UPI001F188A4A|nr:hypothetical protein [Pseudoalteromonas sp. MMG024]MCF6459078.1 hypothetical protein [Pseudoalteromonas sp. MMG024]